jgi:hypothetical protein
MAAGDHLLYCGIAPGNQYGVAAAWIDLDKVFVVPVRLVRLV